MVTANNRIVDETYPYYLALHYEPGFRARRIRDRLRPLVRASVLDMAAIQADRLSVPAQAFTAMLTRVETADAFAGQATGLSAAVGRHHGVGQCGCDAICPSRSGLRLVMEPLLGALAQEALGGGLYGTLMPLGQLRERLLAMLQADDDTLLPPGESWSSLLSTALDRTVAWLLRQELGDDVQSWQWGGDYIALVPDTHSPGPYPSGPSG